MVVNRLITQKEVLDRIQQLGGERPHAYTFRRLLQEGLPAHQHPFRRRLAYDWDEVLAWLEGRAAVRATVLKGKKSA